ncbi:9023_t:CDS:1, partial [Funneliformis caledonium]
AISVTGPSYSGTFSPIDEGPHDRYSPTSNKSVIASVTQDHNI